MGRWLSWVSRTPRLEDGVDAGLGGDGVPVSLRPEPIEVGGREPITL